MRQFVESLKRLYQKGQVSDKKLDSLVAANKITNEEKKYIKE